jgi:hypothetical protein
MRYGLQAQFTGPSLSLLALTLGLSVSLVLLANLLLNRRLLKEPPQTLFQED